MKRLQKHTHGVQRYLCKQMCADGGFIALFYLQFCQTQPSLEEGRADYGQLCEESETEELLVFVQRALQEIERRHVSIHKETLFPEQVRISRDYRIYIGPKELRIRPMAKSVLLLFLKHPEGIALKTIGDHRAELLYYYRKLMRDFDPGMAEKRIQHILDIFNNDLNVNIARINTAINTLVDGNTRSLYQIQGGAGKEKTILLDRAWVRWER